MKNPNYASCRRRERSRLQRLAGLRKLQNVVEKGAGRTSAYPDPHLGPGQRGRGPRGPYILQVLGKSRFGVWRKRAAQEPPCGCFYHVRDILEDVLQASWRCWFQTCTSTDYDGSQSGVPVLDRRTGLTSRFFQGRM